LKRVLVVEAEAAVRDAVCEMVKAQGYTCVCASTDAAAYRIIPTLPTLTGLVIDVNLGASNAGYEVARFGRQVIPDLAVILMSGEPTQERRPEHGVPNSTLLAKPFLSDQLRDALANIPRPGELPPDRPPTVIARKPKHL
jgi:CheY-like chemotaxis protein